MKYSELAQTALKHAEHRKIFVAEVSSLQEINRAIKKGVTKEKRQALEEAGVRYANAILAKG